MKKNVMYPILLRVTVSWIIENFAHQNWNGVVRNTNVRGDDVLDDWTVQCFINIVILLDANSWMYRGTI